jgi:Serine/threonine-protein kinase smg-1
VTLSSRFGMDDFARRFQLSTLSTPHTGTFRPQHFQIVMSHLGIGNLVPKSTGDEITSSDDAKESSSVPLNSPEWLKRLFFGCQAQEEYAATDIFKWDGNANGCNNVVATVNNLDDMLKYWALWESARYCILARLRTPFGGPQQVHGVLFGSEFLLVGD